MATGTRSRQQDGLPLPASPEAARLARRHVRDLLTRAGHPDWSDAAELAVSEVVTNGVLHAHTDLLLRVEVGSNQALVEVSDGSTVLPQQRHGSDAGDGGEGTTGRGLALLAAVTLARGVRASRTGKVVWFTVGAGPEQDDGELLAAFREDAEWEVDVPPALEQGRPVVLLGFPATLWLAVREHHQALMRELVLYLAEHGDALPHPPDLVQADAARTLIWTTFLAALDARDGARSEHDDGPAHGHDRDRGHDHGPLDLRLVVPPGLETSFGALQDALDTAERLATQDLLLVSPGLPELIAVRDWACEQIVAQLGGVAPSPWPGTDQERFTTHVHERVTPDPRAWDTASVTGSSRYVVAADEANRIVAVSRPLAELTGWDPDELVGRRVVTLVPPALREAHVAGFSRHLTTGRGSLLGMPLTLPVLHHDGRELTCTVVLERDESPGRPIYRAWIDPVGS